MKFIAPALATLALAGVLTACGSDKDAKATAGEPANEASSETTNEASSETTNEATDSGTPKMRVWKPEARYLDDCTVLADIDFTKVLGTEAELDDSVLGCSVETPGPEQMELFVYEPVDRPDMATLAGYTEKRLGMSEAIDANGWDYGFVSLWADGSDTGNYGPRVGYIAYGVDVGSILACEYMGTPTSNTDSPQLLQDAKASVDKVEEVCEQVLEATTELR